MAGAPSIFLGVWADPRTEVDAAGGYSVLQSRPSRASRRGVRISHPWGAPDCCHTDMRSGPVRFLLVRPRRSPRLRDDVSHCVWRGRRTLRPDRRGQWLARAGTRGHGRGHRAPGWRSYNLRYEPARPALDQPAARAVGVPAIAKGVGDISPQRLPHAPASGRFRARVSRFEVATEPRAKTPGGPSPRRGQRAGAQPSVPSPRPGADPAARWTLSARNPRLRPSGRPGAGTWHPRGSCTGHDMRRGPVRFLLVVSWRQSVLRDHVPQWHLAPILSARLAVGQMGLRRRQRLADGRSRPTARPPGSRHHPGRRVFGDGACGDSCNLVRPI